MTITTLPTRNPADLGAALYDARTPNANELAAVNVEKIKDRLIEVVTEVGLTSGATAGSINAMRAAFTSGAYDAILRHTGSAYGAQRLGGGVGAPTVADDSGEGYAPGSWWVQVFGLDNPATAAFFLCIDAAEDAAVWIQLGSAVSGTSSVEEIAIADGVTLAAGDAVAFASGRATLSDARAGSIVSGYVGQCVTGGTGDVGGTALARVAVAGIAPASGLTAGLPVYLSTSAQGDVTTTVPSGLGALWQRVGFAISSTEFTLQIDAPISIDWCSPLDIPTNGIFYGRASSANLLASGRITTNGIADLFLASSRVATIDASGNAPLYIAGGAPNGHDAWFFDSARSDRLRIVHDAGMTGVAWTMAVMHFATSAASQRCLVAKCNGSTPSPIDMHIIGVEEVRLEGSIGLVAKGWRFDAASRPSSGSNAIYSGTARIGGASISALSAGTDDILIGLRNDFATPYLGRISGFALWNRQLSAAEHVGLAKWARREWGV